MTWDLEGRKKNKNTAIQGFGDMELDGKKKIRKDTARLI